MSNLGISEKKTEWYHWFNPIGEAFIRHKAFIRVTIQALFSLPGKRRMKLSM